MLAGPARTQEQHVCLVTNIFSSELHVCTQVFLPRRQGLFQVTGRVQNKDPESCPRSRHILAHMPSSSPRGRQVAQNPAWPRGLDKVRWQR
eukprot:1159284-Pelagomonas_calceolata.AAC.6